MGKSYSSADSLISTLENKTKQHKQSLWEVYEIRMCLLSGTLYVSQNHG